MIKSIILKGSEIYYTGEYSFDEETDKIVLKNCIPLIPSFYNEGVRFLPLPFVELDSFEFSKNEVFCVLENQQVMEIYSRIKKLKGEKM